MARQDGQAARPRGRSGRLTLDEQIMAVADGEDVAFALLDLGFKIAEDAAVLAPRSVAGSHGGPPGAGARSIHPELRWVGGHPEVRVAWDQDHFYMSFAELGTDHQDPTPFLRPAANRYA